MKKQAAPAVRKADQAAPRTKRGGPNADKKVVRGVESNTSRNTPGVRERPKGLSPLERAQKKLKEAAEKLKSKIPSNMILKEEQLKTDSVKGCADVNCIAEHMGLAIESLMHERSRDDESDKGTVKELVKRLVKKSLPFVEPGLTIAQVLGGFLTIPYRRVRYPNHTV